MKTMMQKIALCEQDTIDFANELVRLLRPNDVVLLKGDLGSGKTFLVKQVCRLLNTEDEASSPSFALIHQYRGPIPVNHFDFYRLHSEMELDQLGWEELLNTGAITFIEWPELIEKYLDDFYSITIELDEDKRVFTLTHVKNG